MTAKSTAALPPSPSGRTLAKATVVALAVAAVVLVTTVLPAEYGIDPLGTGKALGLSALFAAGEAVDTTSGPATIVPTGGGPVHPRTDEYRVDTREFTIAPGTGMEFKYTLDQGATMLYSWKASNFVNFDFHTEPAGKPKEASDSFEKGEGLQKRGSYTAPYNGIHGWYWENKNTSDVKVTLTTVGFYTEATLFLPKARPEVIAIPARP